MIDLIARTSTNDNPLSDLNNSFGFYPAKAPAVLFTILFAFQLIVIVYHHVRHRVWWSHSLTLGVAFETLGFATRSWLTWNPNSGDTNAGSALFKCQYACILIGPIFHAAFIYTVFGRLSRETPRHFTLILPKIVAPCFFVSDILSFLIQVAGAGVLLSADTHTLVETGDKIIQAGLGVNLASFVLFLVFCSYFTYCARQFVLSKSFPWSRYCVLPLWFSAVAILVRQIYRVIEFSNGFYGFVAIHEVYFYVFDTLPIFLAGLVWCVFFPEKFIFPGYFLGSVPSDEETELKQSI
ncbi:RTA1-domain-containing protein [Nadsonia fulvescens var. elongata DSM 6958]|uniref:RTA1-domain-containing protein n=1 Tax=Nadsonia fulvescens var. elongata DSM 6958 TaxID=857566 RepID=A0A1E3PEC7_9ASCO|nr:RTA1-domain-containing protein [Nadsonia fulvescens var. elongata DSM 6958]